MIDRGDRIPNFLVTDADGKNRMFYAEVTGRPIVLVVCRSVRDPEAAAALAGLAALSEDFQAAGADRFGLSADDPQVAAAAATGFLVFPDSRGRVVPYLLASSGAVRTFVLDANQRVLAVLDGAEAQTHGRAALQILRSRAADPPARLVSAGAPPVLMLPNVLDAGWCRRLIELWRDRGHEEGGVAGRYGNTLVAERKRSLDHVITDPAINRELSETLARRIGPELQKGFCFFAPFFFDGHVILSYLADRKDFFGAHRDNLAPGTQNRRFALSLNLNEGYEGGELRFPEYGPDLYRPDPGTACVFSCSLLHEALPVRSGQRWVLTTFFRESDRQASPAGQPPAGRPPAGRQ